MWAVVAILLIVVLYVVGAYEYILPVGSKRQVFDLTNRWLTAVESGDTEAIKKIFCPNASLIGTVSQTKRTDDDIAGYFDYFAKLPGLKVLKREHNIRQISPKVWTNSMFVTWKWDDAEPIITRMTFTIAGGCITQLHSSSLPNLNSALLAKSGKA